MPKCGSNTTGVVAVDLEEGVDLDHEGVDLDHRQELEARAHTMGMLDAKFRAVRSTVAAVAGVAVDLEEGVDLDHHRQLEARAHSTGMLDAKFRADRSSVAAVTAVAVDLEEGVDRMVYSQ